MYNIIHPKKFWLPVTAPLYKTGSVAFPVLTFRDHQDATTSGSPQSTGSFSIGAGAVNQTVFFAIANADAAFPVTSVTVTSQPSGNIQSATIDTQYSALQCTLLGHCSITAATDTSAVINISFAGNPFATCRSIQWTAPTSGFSSLTPVGAASAGVSGTSTSVSIATTAGGFIIAGFWSSNGTSQSNSWTGTTETLTNSLTPTAGFALWGGGADTNPGGVLATNASSAVDITYGVTGVSTLSAACFR